MGRLILALVLKFQPVKHNVINDIYLKKRLLKKLNYLSISIAERLFDLNIKFSNFFI